MSEKSLMPRKFRIGQCVRTKSGLEGRVIGSAIYGVVKGELTPSAHVEYRIKFPDRKKTLYRRENEIKASKDCRGIDLRGFNIAHSILESKRF